MAGHLIYDYLKSTNKYHICRTLRDQTMEPNCFSLDIENTPAVQNFINQQANVDIIINCIGLLVKESIKSPDRALIINSWFPKYLERKYKNTQTKIIHLSTDCIFDGRQNGFYNESDLPNETNYYGKSKALGEIINEKDLTFRMSIIGPEVKNGTGLFRWFMSQSGSIDGYTDLLWNGVTTLELSKAIDKAIDQHLCGLYHLVNNQKISKHDLLKLIKECFNKQITINPTSNISLDKTLYNNRNDFDFRVPTFLEMIKEMKKWILSSNKYKN